MNTRGIYRIAMSAVALVLQARALPAAPAAPPPSSNHATMPRSPSASPPRAVAAPATKGTARGKVAPKKKHPPVPMYPARSPLQTAVVMSDLQISLHGSNARVQTRYRMATPEGSCPTQLHLFVPLGFPGNPNAFSARWTTGSDTQVLAYERVPVLPSWAHALSGPSNQAGVAIHLSKAALASWCGVNEALLELVFESPAPHADSRGERTWILPMHAGSWGPIGVERIRVQSDVAERAGVDGAARWCGPDAKDPPLMVWGGRAHVAGVVLPALSTRRAQDDLCVSLRAPAEQGRAAPADVQTELGRPTSVP